MISYASQSFPKKLAMSNWGKRDLTLNEISYAARDAWVSVAIVEQLQKSSNAFNPESLMNEEFMKSQRSMDVVDTRAKIRKTAKLELKEIAERQKLLDKSNGEDEDERKQELYKILDTYRADQPPSFSETEITLQSF
jgi:ribonuclease D